MFVIVIMSVYCYMCSLLSLYVFIIIIILFQQILIPLFLYGKTYNLMFMVGDSIFGSKKKERNCFFFLGFPLFFDGLEFAATTIITGH